MPSPVPSGEDQANAPVAPAAEPAAPAKPNVPVLLSSGRVSDHCQNLHNHPPSNSLVEIASTKGETPAPDLGADTPPPAAEELSAPPPPPSADEAFLPPPPPGEG